MKGSPLVRMSFSIEEELFQELENLIARAGYRNRSEYIRDMIRKQLTRRECAENHEVIGTVSVLCDLKTPGIETRVNYLLDHAAVNILGSSRFVLDTEHSSTMITAAGIGKEIRELAAELRKLKGVIQAEFVITSKKGN